MTVNQKEECKIREKEKEREWEREHIPSWTNPEPKIDNRAENSSQKHGWRRSEHSDTVKTGPLPWRHYEDQTTGQSHPFFSLTCSDKLWSWCSRSISLVLCLSDIWSTQTVKITKGSKGITGCFYSYHYNINILVISWHTSLFCDLMVMMYNIQLRV